MSYHVWKNNHKALKPTFRNNTADLELMMKQPDFIDGKRILKAHAVRHIEPIYEKLAKSLAQIPELNHIKIFTDRLTASNILSQDKKKNPVVTVGANDIVGIELLIDSTYNVVQFYSITSSIKGCGRKMVDAVVNATPDSWELAVVFDWSGGFWKRMVEEHPRIVVF